MVRPPPALSHYYYQSIISICIYVAIATSTMSKKHDLGIEIYPTFICTGLYGSYVCTVCVSYISAVTETPDLAYYHNILNISYY